MAYSDLITLIKATPAWLQQPCLTSTTLAAPIDAAMTSLTVSSMVGFFPATFTILIDTEQLAVTATSGATWTVTRGMNGTTAAIHGINATITQVLTVPVLTAEQVATAINSLMITSPTSQLVLLWQIKVQGMTDGWWLGMVAATTNPYAVALMDYYNDFRFNNVDLSLAPIQTTLAGLVSTGLMTQAQSNTITAMATPQVPWTSVYWQGDVGGGHIGSAWAAIAQGQ